MAQFFVLSLLYMAVLYRVDGGISISPSVPVMGALSPSEAVFTCDTSGLNFDSITSIQISRKRATETQFTILVSIFNTVVQGKPALLPYLASDTDLTTRDGIDSGGEGIQADNTKVSSLQLKIQQLNLLCTDEAEYECKVAYYSPTTSSETDKSYINMTISVPPKDLTLTVTHNGVVPGEGLQSSPTQFNVGDVIQLSCSGSIGSNSNQEFKWQRTPLSGSPPFNPYTPDAANENKGTVPATPVKCMYSRTATLSYNISQEDGNRKHMLRFKCEAVYGTQTQESDTYYITVAGTGGNQNPNPGTAAASAGGSGGMIAGIVVGVVAVLVLVVLLVYFLWYRKRGGAGDTYRTKEEQGSSNPNLTDPDMYATVDKNKSKGHENKAMDEKHESRSKRNRDHNDYPRSYDNGRKNDYGNRNYALDRDEDDDYHSRDGSPTVHMSSGPIGTGV